MPKQTPTIKLYSHTDDQPQNGQGKLIPPRTPTRRPVPSFVPESAQTTTPTKRPIKKAVVAVVAVALLAVGVGSIGGLTEGQLAAAPSVTIINPQDDTIVQLDYGPEASLTSETIFTETRAAFIDEAITFIEVDLAEERLRFFKDGVLFKNTRLTNVPAAGTWWDVPAGLYTIEQKTERPFSTRAQAYLPWRLTFQGNYLIHGTPKYPDGVTADISVGVQIEDAIAEDIFAAVTPGVPILVHTATTTESDEFVYQAQVPEVTAAQYLVADIHTDAIIAATGTQSVAPVASITKLMTALVAAQELDLDSRVSVVSPTFVTSLVPRLQSRGSVSAYSLLELLLVESSNEAAETIAEVVGEADFITAMNDRAQHIGMEQTVFHDTSGLAAENTSTPHDLYTLTKHLYEQHRFIFDITAQKKLPNTYVGGEFADLVNFNEIESVDSFIGGKVGETEAAGQTSVTLHEVEIQNETRTLVVILLNSEDRSADIKALLSYVESQYR